MSRTTRRTYAKARKLCEEIHDDFIRKGGLKSKFCNDCYKREGKCFPCADIRELSEKRYGKSIVA